MGAAMRYQPQGRVRLNPAHPLVRDLAFAWVASAPDINLVTGRAATIQGTAPAKTPYLTHMGRRFIGTGSIDFGNTPETNFGGLSQQTVLAEIFMPDTSVADGYIFGRVQGGWDYFLQVSKGSQQFAYAAGGDAGGVVAPVASVGGGLVPFQGRPVPLVGTYDKTNAKIYVDGALKNTKAYTGPFSTSGDPFAIGARGGGGQTSLTGVFVGIVLIFKRVLTDAEILSISQNTGQLIDAGSSSSAYQAAIASASAPSGGGVVTNTPVSPALASLVLTGYAPTVVRGASVTIGPAPGGLSIVGYAPAVTQGTTTSVVPGVGALSIAGYAPSITQSINASIAPGSAGLALTGYAPTVARTANQSQTPQPGALAITGYAPTVVRSFNQSIVVPASAGSVTMLALTGYAPSISQGLNVVPQYYDATIMQLSAVRGTANLGPDRIQQTVDLV